MIRIGLNSSQKGELPILDSHFRKQVAYHSDERLEIVKLGTLREFVRLVEAGDFWDILCVDITVPQAIPVCERLRQGYPGSLIVLIATADISPVIYMKPTIMAASLLLRPVREETVKEMAKALVGMLGGGEKNEDGILVAKTQEGRSRIPYSSILYIESREKKIYICTASREYSVRSTVEQMEEELPKSFLRCHRSYIVNCGHILTVKLAQGMLVLEGDICIPVSRRYKGMLKEYIL